MLLREELNRSTSPGTVVKGERVQVQYAFVRTLGEGTFSRVFCVSDQHNKNKQYALKVLVDKIDAMKEAQLLFSINKNMPGQYIEFVCKMIDVVTITKFTIPGIVLEKGVCSVLEVLELNSYNPFPIRHIRKIICQLLTALEGLHLLEIAHLDIKLENILFKGCTRFFQTSDNHIELFNPVVMLCDFNCSLTFSILRKEAYLNSTIQTFHYRAPEIPLGLEPTSQVDIFSIGCVMGELACGQLIFDDDVIKNNKEFTVAERARHIHLLERVLGECPRSVYSQSPYRFIADGTWKYEENTENYSNHKIEFLEWQKRIAPRNNEIMMMVNAMNKLLAWPDRRISAKVALNEPFFRYQENDKEIHTSYNDTIEIKPFNEENIKAAVSSTTHLPIKMEVF